MSIDNLWTAGGIVSIPLLAFSLLAISWDIKKHGWWHRVKNVPTLTRNHWRSLKLLLQIAIAVYLISHGVFGAFDAKAGLAGQYDATGISSLFGSTENALTAIGWFEIILGISVLFAPVAPLLFFICFWKIATESLFIWSGTFFGGFEFIERGASMVAPLCLYLIISLLKQPNFSDRRSSDASLYRIAAK